MIQKIRALLKGAATAASFEAALAQVSVPALEAARDAALRERDGLLVDGTDPELRAAEAKLLTARAELERGEAVVKELTRKIVEAKVTEAEAALRERHAKLRAEADQFKKWVTDEYPALAAQIAAKAQLEADLRERQNKYSHDVTRIETAHGKTEIDGAPHFYRCPFAEADPERTGETLLASFLSLPPQGEFEGHQMTYYR